ncbi:MAG: PLP-dependent transferase [Bacteroidota bacterium]
MKFETRAIRLQAERSAHREHSVPLFPTSSFVFDDAEQMRAVFAGEEKGNLYSRFTNPNCQELEQKIAALEECDAAVATASGMSAVVASFLTFLNAGDHLLASRAIFGSTHQFILNHLNRWGIEHTFLDAQDTSEWAAAIRPNTRMLYLETPSNPRLDIIDMAWASDFCKKYDLIYVVDNCLASPYLQQPARFGADLVVHSATKFIDGQGRVLGGLVAGPEVMIDPIRKYCRNTGPALSPFNAWILSKSLETLAVRMDRHSSNAEVLADFLTNHSAIAKVNYPFSAHHPAQAIARKQMRQGGGIVTFELKGGLDAGRQFLDRLSWLSLTANLGDTRTIVSHPASTTHAKLTEEARQLVGITSGLVRVSVGLEHVDDIMADIEQALVSL